MLGCGIGMGRMRKLRRGTYKKLGANEPMSFR